MVMFHPKPRKVSKNQPEEPSQGATRHHKVQLPFLVGNSPSPLPWQVPRFDDRLKLWKVMHLVRWAPRMSWWNMVKPIAAKMQCDQWKGDVIPIGKGWQRWLLLSNSFGIIDRLPPGCKKNIGRQLFDAIFFKPWRTPRIQHANLVAILTLSISIQVFWLLHP